MCVCVKRERERFTNTHTTTTCTHTYTRAYTQTLCRSQSLNTLPSILQGAERLSRANPSSAAAILLGKTCNVKKRHLPRARSATKPLMTCVNCFLALTILFGADGNSSWGLRAFARHSFSSFFSSPFKWPPSLFWRFCRCRFLFIYLLF